VEQSIPCLGDDLQLLRTTALHLANAAEVSRRPLKFEQDHKWKEIVGPLKAREEAETPEWK
jgi:hypothetical protein